MSHIVKNLTTGARRACQTLRRRRLASSSAAMRAAEEEEEPHSAVREDQEDPVKGYRTKRRYTSANVAPEEAIASTVYPRGINSYSTDKTGVYCLQFDLAGLRNYSIGDKRHRDFERRLTIDVTTMKPDVVYLQQSDFRHYQLGLSQMMKGLGYEGYFYHKVDNRGQATFYRPSS